MPFVTERYIVPVGIEGRIRAHIAKHQPVFGMGVISETTYFRTYSRVMSDGRREMWPDTVIRVLNGVFSILKTHYVQHHLAWRDADWDEEVYSMGKYIGRLRVLPPGRGLWAMGTELIYERGSAFLYNCGAHTTANLLDASDWTMDMLMCGVGVGADVKWDGVAYPPREVPPEPYVVVDSREGWVASVRRLLSVWIPRIPTDDRPGMPVFDYSLIRPVGTPLKTFGGVSSGYAPLKELHDRLCLTMTQYVTGKISKTRCCADVINSIGCCVVAGNIRRSAEILLGRPSDADFIDLKNSERFPDRSSIAWMSNNSVVFDESQDFTRYSQRISTLIQTNGEPGVVNLVNIRDYGRLRDRTRGNDGGRPVDQATLMNPCVTGDTWVLTDLGPRQVVDLVGKQFVAVCDGKLYPSTSNGFWLTSASEPVYELETRSGMKIRTTANHKFHVMSFQRPANHHQLSYYQWEELQNINIGDFVRLHVHSSGADAPKHSFGYVETITYTTREAVYDCTIPGCNYFDGNGFVVHNCSEIPLESAEVCNLAEVFPTRCCDAKGVFVRDKFMKACDIATFYTTVVTLLPTHRPETNVVVARNRRIGVSLSGVAMWKDSLGATQITRLCRDAYRFVVERNAVYAAQFGIPRSIRVTTIKPSGSISLLAGTTPGMHYPAFKYFIRRIQMGKNEVFRELARAGYPWEDRIVDPATGRTDPNTAVVEFPGAYDCARTAEEVGMWEQLAFLALLQREWADNSVSVTISFHPETEGHQIEHALGMYLPVVKSLSMLPHTPLGAYPQMPYEGISKEEYERRIRTVRPVQWGLVASADSEAQPEKYCTNDRCVA